MSLNFANLIRLATFGMFVYYMSAIGLSVLSHQFYIVVAAFLAFGLLGEFIGYVTKDKENLDAIHEHLEAAKILQAYEKSGALKQEGNQKET